MPAKNIMANTGTSRNRTLNFLSYFVVSRKHKKLTEIAQDFKRDIIP